MAGDGIEILSLADIGCYREIPETQSTIEGNSRQKANFIKENFGYDCFSDDTGLFVDALDGAPGVVSARYAGEHCSPADNIVKLLSEMEGKDNRDARFRTVVTLRIGDEAVQFEGTAEGSIARATDGTSGFGYDPVFISKDYGITFASMSSEAKNEISHRGKAMRKLFEYLRQK